MFLCIFEDSTIKKYEQITEDDLNAANDGVLDIIDVSVADHPKRYWDSQWIDIELG